MNRIIRFISRHRALDIFFSNFVWYRRLFIKQSLEIIDKHIAESEG